MTHYSLRDVFSYNEDQLKEIIGEQLDVNFSRKLLINKLLQEDQLDETSKMIVESVRFWKVFDMTDTELNALSWEDSRLDMISDVLGTQLSTEMLDTPHFNVDISLQILLNTTSLDTISNLYKHLLIIEMH